MKLRRSILFLFALAAGLLCSGDLWAQNVTVRPKVTVYHRKLPIADFKRTFTIRRPIVTARSPQLSKLITAAVDPVSILEIDIKDEINQTQWLTAADYRIVLNSRGVLSVEVWMEGVGAYPDGVTRWVVVDTANGLSVAARDVFTDLEKLAARIKRMQTAEVQKVKAAEPDSADLLSGADFTVADLDKFSVDARGVVFHYEYGFPHVAKALEPAGEFRLSWRQVKPFVKRGGLLERFVRR
ncbi:MAG: hypothetical protein ACK4S4_09780 [Pyrinomonadaceae bacterium]